MRDPEKIAAMTRGQLLVHVRDVLLTRADRVRRLEEGLIKIGHATEWHAENREAHDAMCAAAAGYEKIIEAGRDQVKRGVKVNPLIDAVVDALRSSLISEAINREPKEIVGIENAAS